MEKKERRKKERPEISPDKLHQPPVALAARAVVFIDIYFRDERIKKKKNKNDDLFFKSIDYFILFFKSVFSTNSELCI